MFCFMQICLTCEVKAKL